MTWQMLDLWLLIAAFVFWLPLAVLAVASIYVTFKGWHFK